MNLLSKMVYLIFSMVYHASEGGDYLSKKTETVSALLGYSETVCHGQADYLKTVHQIFSKVSDHV